jgi:hypothetical protein
VEGNQVTLGDRILEAVREGRLYEYYLDLGAHIATLPRWRWLRRLHLERQRALIGLCGECYSIGYLNAKEKI